MGAGYFTVFAVPQNGHRHIDGTGLGLHCHLDIGAGILIADAQDLVPDLIFIVARDLRILQRNLCPLSVAPHRLDEDARQIQRISQGVGGPVAAGDFQPLDGALKNTVRAAQLLLVCPQGIVVPVVIGLLQCPVVAGFGLSDGAQLHISLKLCAVDAVQTVLRGVIVVGPAVEAPLYGAGVHMGHGTNAFFGVFVIVAADLIVPVQRLHEADDAAHIVPVPGDAANGFILPDTTSTVVPGLLDAGLRPQDAAYGVAPVDGTLEAAIQDAGSPGVGGRDQLPAGAGVAASQDAAYIIALCLYGAVEGAVLDPAV